MELRAHVQHHAHHEHQDAERNRNARENPGDVAGIWKRASGVEHEAEDRPDDDKHAAEQRQDERGKRSLFQADASMRASARAYLIASYIFGKRRPRNQVGARSREPLRTAARSEAECLRVNTRSSSFGSKDSPARHAPNARRPSGRSGLTRLAGRRPVRSTTSSAHRPSRRSSPTARCARTSSRTSSKTAMLG